MPPTTNHQVKSPTTFGDVLTLEQAAKYLQLSKETVKREAASGKLPGRRIDRSWRFLKSALDAWLGGREGPDTMTAFLAGFGAFKHDDTLPQLVEEIYKARGRPEVDAGANS